MGLEATSWDWLRDGIKRTLPAFSLLERIENGVGLGMADVNYLIRGTEGWIELKAVQLPKRWGTPVLTDKQGLNKEQINWHLLRNSLAGRTWVFVSADPYRWLVSGVYAREINGWSVDELSTYAAFWYDEKWSKQQWEALVRMLSWRIGA